MKIAPVLAVAVLAGCASPQPLDAKITCPPMRTWTSAEQAALANALAPLPSNSVILTLERDWQAERDAIRACSNSPKPK